MKRRCHDHKRSSRDTDGSTKLARLVAKGRWDAVVAGLRTQKGQADARKRNEHTGELLFHNREFYRTAPLAVIQALVEAYPDGIIEPEKLHMKSNLPPLVTAIISCREDKRHEVVKLFVTTNPKCLSTKALKCKIPPIHDAFPYCEAETVKFMIDAYPGVIYHEHESCGMPIHHACIEGMHGTVDVLLDAASEVVAQQIHDGYGMLPLHLASRPNENDIRFSMETYRRLLSAYPQAAQEEDAKGRLPLHHACAGAPFRPNNQPFVSELVTAYPEGVKHLDAANNLPLHYLGMPRHRGTWDFSGGEDILQEESEDEANHVNDWLCHNNHSKIEQDFVLLMEAYPEALLEIDEKGRLVLGTLAKFGFASRRVWDTAARVCPRAFLCSSARSKCPLAYLSFELGSMNMNDDNTNHDGGLRMRDSELAGVVLRHTFEVLFAEYSEPQLQAQPHPVPTVLHQLAYCSKFVPYSMHLMNAVEQAVTRELSGNAPYFNADSQGNLPLHLACIAPPPPPILNCKSAFSPRDELQEGDSPSLLIRITTFSICCPDAARLVNADNKTPLQMLMEHAPFVQKEWVAEDWIPVKLLVEANPDDGTRRYTDERLYPFILAAIGDDTSSCLTSSYEMLLSFVSLCNLSNPDEPEDNTSKGNGHDLPSGTEGDVAERSSQHSKRQRLR
jgi:ankyrin repeat protein